MKKLSQIFSGVITAAALAGCSAQTEHIADERPDRAIQQADTLTQARRVVLACLQADPSPVQDPPQPPVLTPKTPPKPVSKGVKFMKTLIETSLPASIVSISVPAGNDGERQLAQAKKDESARSGGDTTEQQRRDTDPVEPPPSPREEIPDPETPEQVEKSAIFSSLPCYLPLLLLLMTGGAIVYGEKVAMPRQKRNREEAEKKRLARAKIQERSSRLRFRDQDTH